MSAGLAATTSEIAVFLDADVHEHDRRLRRPADPAAPRASGHPAGQGLLRATAAQHAHGWRPGQRAGRAPDACPCSFPDWARFASPSPVRRRRDAAPSDLIDLEPGYSVEIALLIDFAELFGVHALAQVDLGIRRHRNRPLEELRPMAVDVLRAALERYKVDLPEANLN